MPCTRAHQIGANRRGCNSALPPMLEYIRRKSNIDAAQKKKKSRE
jgi:hypothetical protein